jgi:HAD superfamily hydrolase (TIGR01450 family)
MTPDLFHPDTPHNTARVLGIYEWLRPEMPDAGKVISSYAPSLRDLMDQFDAVLLDGYGVLNIGAEMIPDADVMLADAAAAGIEIIVVTNGASKKSTAAAARYRSLGLEISNQQVVSSRDALEARINGTRTGLHRLGVIDSFSSLPDLPGVEASILTETDPSAWHNVDAIGFFGATRWNAAYQACLEDAAGAGVPVLVANPDVAAPHPGGFSKEPGFWAAMARHKLGDALKLEWYGKPHPPIFDQALKTLEENTGRTNWNRDRIAMVGDTLHTDILGGREAGLKTILVTGHGLFSDGSAPDAIAATGIVPDFIVNTV